MYFFGFSGGPQHPPPILLSFEKKKIRANKARESGGGTRGRGKESSGTILRATSAQSDLVTLFVNSLLSSETANKESSTS